MSSESPEKSPRRKTIDEEIKETANADKIKDADIGEWLPEHAQRIIKRHLGAEYDSSPGGSPTNAQTLGIVDVPMMDNADVAGGISVDDAAAGDAAVLALVARKRAPAASPELPEKVVQPEKLDSPTASTELQQSAEKVTQSLGSPAGIPESSPRASDVSSVGSRAQFFNLYEGDPENEEAQKVHTWLKNLGLGRYFEQLAAEGFDDMSILANVEDNQVDDLLELCPMPKLHEQQLRRGLSRLRNGGNSPPPDMLQHPRIDEAAQVADECV
jgi:hypothetical protein